MPARVPVVYPDLCLARHRNAPPETACQQKRPCPRHCGSKCRDDDHGVHYCCVKLGLSPRNRRCRMHGGATPRGPRAGSYKHGRYSSVLPRDMLKAYRRVRNNPNLLCLEGDIAALETMQRAALAKLDEARADKAVNQEQLWLQFRELAQEKAKLISAERRWISMLRAFFTAEQGMAIMHAIMDSANRTFADQPDKLGAFLAEVVAMLDAESTEECGTHARNARSSAAMHSTKG